MFAREENRTPEKIKYAILCTNILFVAKSVSLLVSGLYSTLQIFIPFTRCAEEEEKRREDTSLENYGLRIRFDANFGFGSEGRILFSNAH